MDEKVVVAAFEKSLFLLTQIVRGKGKEITLHQAAYSYEISTNPCKSFNFWVLHLEM